MIGKMVWEVFSDVNFLNGLITLAIINNNTHTYIVAEYSVAVFFYFTFKVLLFPDIFRKIGQKLHMFTAISAFKAARWCKDLLSRAIQNWYEKNNRWFEQIKEKSAMIFEYDMAEKLFSPNRQIFLDHLIY